MGYLPTYRAVSDTMPGTWTTCCGSGGAICSSTRPRTTGTPPSRTRALPCPLLRPSYTSAATPLHGASASHGCSDALWGKLPALTTAGNLMVTPEPRLQRGGTASYCGALLRAWSRVRAMVWTVRCARQVRRGAASILMAAGLPEMISRDYSALLRVTPSHRPQPPPLS